MISKLIIFCIVALQSLLIYPPQSADATAISLFSNINSDCPQFMPIDPESCKDGKIITQTKDEKGCPLTPICQKEVPNQYPEYGHASDYSWVSGKLQYNPLEGGCWSIVFSETQKDDSNYYGIFTLNLNNQQEVSGYNDGDFVVAKGEIKGQKASMACPVNIYGANEIVSNSSLQIYPAVKKIETKENKNEGQINIVSESNSNLVTKIENVPEGLLIKDGFVEAKTSLPVKMKGEEIIVGDSNFEKKIVPPSIVTKIIDGRVVNIQLENCSSDNKQTLQCDTDTPTYKMDVTKNTKLLNLIPLQIDYKYTVNAITGNFISDTKPWFLKNFYFLFK